MAKKSTIQRITVKPSQEERPTDQEIFEVVQVRESDYRAVESVIGRYAKRAVAEFRANGAKMFEPINGPTTTYYVRPVMLVLDSDLMVYMKRLGKGMTS